jgi:hypothetical protein
VLVSFFGLHFIPCLSASLPHTQHINGFADAPEDADADEAEEHADDQNPYTAMLWNTYFFILLSFHFLYPVVR